MFYRIPVNSPVCRAAMVFDTHGNPTKWSWDDSVWEPILTTREVIYTDADVFHFDSKHYYFFLPFQAHPYTVLEVRSEDVVEEKIAKFIPPITSGVIEPPYTIHIPAGLFKFSNPLKIPTSASIIGTVS